MKEEFKTEMKWISICSDVLGWSPCRQNSERVGLHKLCSGLRELLFPDRTSAAQIPVIRVNTLSHPYHAPSTSLSRSLSGGGEGTVVAAGRTLTVALLNLVPCRWQAPSPWRRVTFFPTGRHIVAASPHARGPGTRQQARGTSKPRKLTAAACRPCCPAPVCNQY